MDTSINTPPSVIRIRLFLVFATTLILIAFCLSGWQFYRLDWKTERIAQLHTRAQAQPIDLAEFLSYPDSLNIETHRFKRLRVSGTPVYDSYVLHVGRNLRGEPSLHIVLPVVTDSGVWILVNIGSVKADEMESARDIIQTLRRDHPRMNFSGIARPYIKAPWFAPEHKSGSLIWLVLDPDAIGKSIGLEATTNLPFYLLSEPVTIAEGITPLPGWTIDIPNNHLEYALTWLAIAAGMTIITFLWLREQRKTVALPG